MKKQLIYIHGGEAFDSWEKGVISCWQNLFWKRLKFWQVKPAKWPEALANNLDEFEVLSLKMPGKYNAKYLTWKKHFEEQFNLFDQRVDLVGWSLGANFLVKYLSENDFPVTINSLHLVAGCYGCPGGFELGKDFDRLQSIENIYLYHSRDDFVVDFSDVEKYHQIIPKAVLRVFTDRNHFLQPDFPELIETLRKHIG